MLDENNKTGWIAVQCINSGHAQKIETMCEIKVKMLHVKCRVAGLMSEIVSRAFSNVSRQDLYGRLNADGYSS